MMKIFKYPLNVVDEQVILVPNLSQVLDAQIQNGEFLESIRLTNSFTGQMFSPSPVEYRVINEPSTHHLKKTRFKPILTSII